MIVIAICLHQITNRLIAKCDIFPLRKLLIRILELVGKLFIIPMVFIYFVSVFPNALDTRAVDLIYFILVIAFGYIGLRELLGCKQSLNDAMLLIRKKLDNPAMNELTSIEVTVFNFVNYRKISRSLAHYHRWKREIEKGIQEDGSFDGSFDSNNDVELTSVSAHMSGNQAQESERNSMPTRSNVLVNNGAMNPLNVVCRESEYRPSSSVSVSMNGAPSTNIRNSTNITKATLTEL